MRRLALVVGLVLGLAAIPLAQGPYSAQIQALLQGNNTWTGTNAFAAITVSSCLGCAPTDAAYIVQTPHAGLSAEQAISALSTGILFGTTTTGVITSLGPDLPFANLTQGSALSVLGVTGNATADMASIAAASDGQVLRRSGTTLAFGALDLSNANAVTGTLPIANGTAQWTIVTKPSTTAIQSDITVNNDPHLLFAGAANQTYHFHIYALVLSPTNADFRMNLSVPSGATYNLGDTTNWAPSQVSTSSADIQSMATNGGVQLLTASGVVFMGATPGNINWQWAQQATVASDTSVFGGSWLYYFRTQ